MTSIGKKIWVIPGGHIPLKSTGKEPDFLSQDRISVLNPNRKKVKITLTVFYSGEEPVRYSPIEIAQERLRKIRINDIIDPVPVNLATDYAIVIEADEPVVVQFFRMNTGHANAAIMGTIGFGTDT